METVLKSWMDNDHRIILNVGGVRHETYAHVLKKIPATRLSRLTPNLANYDPVLNEYFFDRHPGVFSMILNYYRTGKLHYPTNVCGPLFEEELEDTQETLAIIESLDLDKDPPTQEEIAKRFGWEDDYYSNNLSKWQQFKPRIWSLFDEPWSSKYSRVSLAFNSTTFFYSLVICSDKQINYNSNKIKTFNNDIQRGYLSGFGDEENFTPVQTFKQNTGTHPAFFYIDLICNLYFTVELAARMIFAPSLSRFLCFPITLIDLSATASFYLDWMASLWIDQQKYPDSTDFLSILCILRLFKLTQHFSGLKILIQTFKASAQELALLVFFVILAIVIFAALVYYAERIERNPHNQFTSIPAGLWWAIVTMCTIGFGDMVPKTYLGMLVGSVCALMGVLTIALPVPVIVANFSNLYSHSQARAKLPRKRRRVLQAHEVKHGVIKGKPRKKSS
ncbi:unnamed protein product [Enterobius vermicularis]|uniref:BTB domain-containing protein n=1 Tax=Enterobius vermicularis TaxID=51028 RepID=A0A0N4V586_ENTVE|nr:unnamed protein product [Enterobius vermicularis]